MFDFMRKSFIESETD